MGATRYLYLAWW